MAQLCLDKIVTKNGQIIRFPEQLLNVFNDRMDKMDAKNNFIVYCFITFGIQMVELFEFWSIN